MRRVAVFTGTRAEYGLLYWLLKEIQESPDLELKLIVGAAHLSHEFGETWREIEKDGFAIDGRVEMLLSSNTNVGVVKSIGLGTLALADVLDQLRPDVLVLLGDRFETLAAAQAAVVMKIPIAHLHGGEITEGAYDDSIRHAVTKLATLHFVAAEPYRRRVVQMGEAPDRVFLVGALGLDTLERTPRMSLDELAAALEFPLRRPFFLVTYHPATLAAENPASAMSALFAALERYPDHQVVITYPNADSGGRTIIPLIEAFAQRWPRRVLARPSLGMRAYTSAMALADAVVGNSSSGIIEAPSVGVPTVNVGARQKGRLAATSVLHCAADESAIASALERATSDDFRALCRDAVNPYGSGGVARAIVARLAEEALSPIKRFHDVT